MLTEEFLSLVCNFTHDVLLPMSCKCEGCDHCTILVGMIWVLQNEFVLPVSCTVYIMRSFLSFKPRYLGASDILVVSALVELTSYDR